MFKKIFSPIKKTLIFISLIINNIINFVLLSIVFLIGVGFTSLISKMFKKSFLDLKEDSKGRIKKSFWIKKKLNKQNIESYYRMF